MRTLIRDRHSRVHRELRQSLMHPFFIAGLATGSLLLLGGWLGWIATAIFPWDALSILGLSTIALLLQRYGLIAQANNWFIIGLFWAVSFNMPFYGVNHPLTALFLPLIVISGLLIGRLFQITIVTLCSFFVMLFAFAEYSGWQQPLVATIPIGDAPALIRSILLWVGLLNITGWLVYVFAEKLERATTMARGQTLALVRITGLLNDNPELDHLMAQVLTTIGEQLQADTVALFLVDEGSAALIRQSAYANGEASRAAAPIEPDDISPLWVEISVQKRPIVVADVASDHRLRFHKELLVRGVGAMLVLPLLHDHRVIGLVTLTNGERRTYLPEEIDLAQALVGQMTLAQQLAKLAQANRTAAIAQERNRIARELHDTLAQGFTGIIVQLEAAEDVVHTEPSSAIQHLQHARQLARESLNEARRSVMALLPHMLEHQPLGAAIERIAIALTTPYGPTITCEQIGAPRPLAPARARHLLRITQEALTNALKYADARTIRIRLWYTDTAINVQVEDDGRGFAVNEVNHGFGLTGMRERADLIGAALTIASQPGHGTQITVRAPYE